MSKDIKQILEPYFLKLPELRGSPSLWAEFKCLPETSGEGTSVDTGHQQRTNLLISLFYDQRTSDENLLRYLLRQEIEMHRHITSQSVFDSIKINISLLSRFRHVDNIELFVQAKQANPNTLCALDAISFVSPGVLKSYDHLPNLSEQYRQVFIETLGATPEQCAISEEEVSRWIDDQCRLLPVALDKLSLEDEIHLADILGHNALLNSKITDWIAGIKKWDKDACHTWFGYETMRRNIQGQINALKKTGEFEAEKTEHKQLNFFYLSGLCLEAKNIEEAHKNICYSLNNYPAETMTWETCRMYADRFLDIIIATKDGHVPVSIDSFKWLKNYLDYEPWLENWDIKIIPKIMTASAMAGDSKEMKKFSELFIMRKKEQFDRMKG